jgi:crotonobetaine/carnitine-CoA ligase
VFCVNPISNPLNQINMLAALSANLKFVLGEKFLASDWIHQIGRFAPYWQKNMGRGLVGYLTADQARQVLLQEPTLRDGKNALRALLYSGELNESEVNHFANRFQTNIARYLGLAECGIPLMNPILENKPQSIGKPTIGIEVKVVDAQGGEVPVGKTGQMAINGGRGVTFCKGYYMDEKRNSKVIKGDWFYTDFNTKCDAEGYFYVIGK